MVSSGFAPPPAGQSNNFLVPSTERPDSVITTTGHVGRLRSVIQFFPISGVESRRINISNRALGRSACNNPLIKPEIYTQLPTEPEKKMRPGTDSISSSMGKAGSVFDGSYLAPETQNKSNSSDPILPRSSLFAGETPSVGPSAFQKSATLVTHPHESAEINARSEVQLRGLNWSKKVSNWDESGVYKKMPESPEWLSNTGAEALINHLKSRNWEKECEKIEFELQSTPSSNLQSFTQLVGGHSTRTWASGPSPEASPLGVHNENDLRTISEVRHSVQDEKFLGKNKWREESFSAQNGSTLPAKPDKIAPGAWGFAHAGERYKVTGSASPNDPPGSFRVSHIISKEEGENSFSLLAGLPSSPGSAVQSTPNNTAPLITRGGILRNGPSTMRSMTEQFSEKETDFLLKRRKTRIRTLKLLKSFQKSGLPFTGMIFHQLPVLPPELRPIIQLGAGQLASSDVNDLYRRILSRNNRLKYYLYETHFVEFLVRSEQQLVQLAVDALLENGKTTSVRHTSGQKRLYKSLSDRIGGKQGRFRMNLLGKRVDYSGRSVIVVGPRLKLFQCGLPYEMAIELFQPFLLRHMLELQLAKTIRAAKNILRFNKPLARQLLHHVVQAHPILLNRAPTLHRLGIQAFQPVLVFGRAIHLHPLVCPAFNADFDGDQMAVHIPLSPQARIEARLLMLASGNWLSASTGQPNVLPSQDMVLGFYYLTIEKYAYQNGRGLFFHSLTDVLQAYELGSIDLHSQIWLKWYGPFTGDSTNKLTNPQKHEKKGFLWHNPEPSSLASPSGAYLETNQDQKPADYRFSSGCLFGEAEPAQPLPIPFAFRAPSETSTRNKNSISRFKREGDQPIEIRINKNGISTKIYSSYQWQEDTKEKQKISYIRTTPGRVLMNQLFHKFGS